MNDGKIIGYPTLGDLIDDRKDDPNNPPSGMKPCPVCQKNDEMAHCIRVSKICPACQGFGYV